MELPTPQPTSIPSVKSIASKLEKFLHIAHSLTNFTEFESTPENLAKSVSDWNSLLTECEKEFLVLANLVTESQQLDTMRPDKNFLSEIFGINDLSPKQVDPIQFLTQLSHHGDSLETHRLQSLMDMYTCLFAKEAIQECRNSLQSKSIHSSMANPSDSEDSPPHSK